MFVNAEVIFLNYASDFATSGMPPLTILICTSGNLTFQYADIVTSLRRGDLRLLKQALDKHEDQYVHIYCVLNIFQPFAITTCFFRY
jgi:hypothetical protein